MNSSGSLVNSPHLMNFTSHIETSSYLPNSFHHSNSSSSSQPLDSSSDLAKLVGETRYVIHTYLVPLVTVVGVLGNLVTILVLTRRQMRTSSTNSYLTALAVSDLLYLVASCSLSLMHSVPGIERSHHLHYWHYWPYGVWLTDAASNTSTWLTVTFTVERYVAVCHPMQGQVYCTVERARRLIAGVFVVCFLSIVTTPLEWRVVQSLSDNGEDTKLSLQMTALGRHDSYRLLFYWFSATFFVFLPLILLVIFNSFLIAAVRRSHRQRRLMTSSSTIGASQAPVSQENRITVMLITVVIIYLLCQLPPACVLVYKTFMAVPKPQSREYLITRFLGNVCNLLMAINSACNFVLYCVMSDKYRSTVVDTMRGFCFRWCHASPPGGTSLYNQTSEFTECANASQLTRVRAHTTRTKLLKSREQKEVAMAGFRGTQSCRSAPRRCYQLTSMVPDKEAGADVQATVI